jgi:hypothetical protein
MQGVIVVAMDQQDDELYSAIVQLDQLLKVNHELACDAAATLCFVMVGCQSAGKSGVPHPLPSALRCQCTRLDSDQQVGPTRLPWNCLAC